MPGNKSCLQPGKKTHTHIDRFFASLRILKLKHQNLFKSIINFIRIFQHFSNVIKLKLIFLNIMEKRNILTVN